MSSVEGPPLNRNRWEEVSRIYHAALSRSVEARGVFLSDACAGDNTLRAEVEALLACEPAANSFLEAPAIQMAGPMLRAADTENSLVGRQVGAYAIRSLIGAGGMGEVYRAYDTKLHREVALKILPRLVAADSERLKRFQREAQALAALNHPSIAHIHGFEEANGVHAIAMELVEGQDLGARLTLGALPLEDVLPIARQLAEALEEAHQHGIIHRDLKPANIKVREDGTVKVLDFGLAKAFDPRGATDTDSATRHTDATEIGLILGTAAYMSPEQAMGKPVDKRADVWAFGVVLFEMLTGQRPFRGEDVAGILAAVLKDTPAWDTLPAGTPSSVRRLLRRCLEKDRRDRLGDMSAVRLDIKDALAGEPATPPLSVQRSQRLAWTGALVTTALLSGLLATSYFRRPAEILEMRLEISTASTTAPYSFALSPDGSRVAFVANDAGESRLWVRPLDALRAEPLGGTEGATFPFWSPDSRSVAFFANGWLKRLDIGSGLPRSLTPVISPRGGSWSRDGVILFAPTHLDPLWRIPEAGGVPVRVTTLRGGGESGHLFPQFLPDGHRFLFYVRGTGDDQGIYLGSLGSEKVTRLTQAETAGAYLAPGWLLFVRNGVLVARRFDSSGAQLSGEPVTVADPVGFEPVMHAGAFSAARDVVMYRPSGGGIEKRQLTWFDRSGNEVGTMGPADDSLLEWPALSPDGRRVAVARLTDGNRDVWIFDGVRQSRLTTDPSSDNGPVWSPDGHWIVFSSNRKGPFNLYRKRSDGVGSDELLLASPFHKNATGWSRDGNLLYSVDNDPKTSYDLWSLPLGRSTPGTATVFLNESYEERNAQFSADGRWVAYVSNESGAHEIYVRPFPGPGGKSPVSTAGGIEPRWRNDGTELYYIAPDSTLMAVPINVKDGTLEAGVPVGLFKPRLVGGGRAYPIIHQYAVAPDGRFLMNVVVGDAPTSPLTILLNWRHNRE